MADTQKVNETCPEVIPITEALDLSEGPHWDHETKALYFVDIYLGEIHKYLPKSNTHTSAVVGDVCNLTKPVTFVVPVKNRRDTLLIGYGVNLATVKWDGVSDTTKNLKILCELEENFPEMRLNDGKISPSGVIFAGSMAEKVNGTYPKDLGHLFAFDPKTSTIRILLSGIGIGNGLAWSLDETILYYIDSLSGQVKSYDYDSKNISLYNERIIFDFRKIGAHPPEKVPDGMTIDVSGNLWVALNNEGKVYCINPTTQKILNAIDFYPTTSVSSVTFGGPSLEDLYVTSVRRDLSEEEKKKQPHAGCVFKVTGLETKGLEGVRANLP